MNRIRAFVNKHIWIPKNREDLRWWYQVRPDVDDYLQDPRTYRFPAPQDQPRYKQPKSTNDRAGKAYYLRDHRRNWPRPVTYTKDDTANMKFDKPLSIGRAYVWQESATLDPINDENYPVDYPLHYRR